MTAANQAVYDISPLGRPVRFHLPNPTDHIQKHILRQQTFYEQGMLEEIAPLVPDGALVIDAGANIGNHTLFFACMLGAKVLSFEPNPDVVAILSRNIELNKLTDTVQLHAVALGAGTGKGTLHHVDVTNVGMAQVHVGETGSVEVRSLDEIVGDRFVHLIKIDVEGMECDVLKGALGTIRRCAPHLIIEAGTMEHLVAIEAILQPEGYRKIKVYNHTPTYLFRKVETPARQPSSVLETMPAHITAALPRTTGVYAGMATVAGNELALRAAITSLLPQVDHLFVYLNGFSEAPEFIRNNPRITATLDKDGKRYGDAGKFFGLGKIEDAIYFSCDDDILYPPDYVYRMISELAWSGGRSIVSVHGSLLVSPNKGYYQNGSRAVFHFKQSLLRTRMIHVPGTGTCAFHTHFVKMSLDDFRYPNMADIWVTHHAQTHDLPVYSIARPKFWLKPIEVKRPTIYEQSSSGAGDDYDTSRRHDEILADILPLSLLAGKPSSPILVLDIAKDADIPKILKSVNFGERDPVIIAVCDDNSEALRTGITSRGICYEIHLLARSTPLSAQYRSLLLNSEAAIQFFKLGGDVRPGKFSVADVGAWLDSTFGTSTSSEG